MDKRMRAIDQQYNDVIVRKWQVLNQVQSGPENRAYAAEAKPYSKIGGA